jgi:arginase
MTKSLSQLSRQHHSAKIRVIGVPLDLGQSRRGVDMGPSAVRVAGLEARLEALGHVVEDAATLPWRSRSRKKKATACEVFEGNHSDLHEAAELVVKTLEAGQNSDRLGGDHSMAAGTVTALRNFIVVKISVIGLIWIDAHTDINTPESSPSGNVHGMPLAALMGLGPAELANIFDFSPKVKPENACW